MEQDPLDIYSYITSEEANFKTHKVPITDSYEWSMYEHVRISTLYRDSKFSEGADDGTRPFKNIIRRIINLEHVATGFDVKDIEPFVNDSDHFYKSFLVRKRHPKWARKHNIDTFIDQTVESYVDYGLALSKHVNSIAPENVPLGSIAFCDQTDVLSGPICIKHQYSPVQLLEFKGKWYDDQINEVITQARAEKKDGQGNVAKTPGKFIEVYELDGMFPRSWLKNPDEDEITEEDKTTYTQQFHVVTYYKSKESGNNKGICLFKGKGDPKKYKAVKRDDVWGRACGFGGIEELFEDQVWTNYNMIRMQALLDYCAKVINVTNDPGVASRYKIADMEMGDFIVQKDGSQTGQLNNTPQNLALFNNAVMQWEQHAQGISSASDAQLGESPTAGTPFKLQELIVNQGRGPHEYRKGKLATHIGEIYRDWVLHDLVKEMNNPEEFIEDLSADELKYVVDRVQTHYINEINKEKILNGEDVYEDETQALEKEIRENFIKGGSKRFFKMLKDELKDLPVDVDINVAGKQKNLGAMTDKLVNIFRQVFANPQGFMQAMQIPGMAKTFNQILEYGGLSEVSFLGLTEAPPMPVDPAALQGNPQGAPVEEPAPVV